MKRRARLHSKRRDGKARNESRRTLIALALFGFVLTFAWSLIDGNFGGPDEVLHLDLVHEMSYAHRYPLDIAYRVDQRVGDVRNVALHGTGFGEHALAGQALRRELRPAFDDGLKVRGSHNQLIQHPPLGWIVPTIGSILIRIVSDPSTWPYDRYLLLLRFLTATQMAVVGPLIYLSARRFQFAHALAVTAAMLPFAVPQVTYVSGVINNDGMLLVVGALVSYFLARILTGDLSTKTSLALGATLGLGMLTKAWGLLLFAAIAGLYAVLLASGKRNVNREDPLLDVTGDTSARVLRSGIVVAAVALLSSAWWWIRNLVISGQIQPHRSILPDPPKGFIPRSMSSWLPRALSWIVRRFWGWFGPFAENVRLPTGLVAVATVVSVLLALAALRIRERPVRLFCQLSIALLSVNALEVLRQGRALHVEHALNQGIQGRYLFIAVPMMSIVCAAGAFRIARRWSRAFPFLTLAAVVVMQAFGLFAAFSYFWGAPTASFGERLNALASWSPLPPVVYTATWIALAAGFAYAILGTSAFALGPSTNLSPEFEARDTTR